METKMSERLDYIVGLLRELANPHSQVMEEVTKKILEEQKNLNTILELFQITESNEVLTIKKAAFINIDQIIRKNNLFTKDFSMVFVEQVKLCFMESLNSEGLASLRYFICLGANDLLRQAPDLWEEYIQLTSSYLVASDTELLGMTVWTEILEFINDEIISTQFPILIEKIDEHMVSENKDNRIIAYKLLLSLASNYEPEAFNECGSIAEKLHAQAQNVVVTTQNEIEANVIFNVIVSLIDTKIPLFFEARGEFFNLALQITEEAEIPNNLKVPCQALLNRTPYYNGDEIEEDFMHFLNASIELGVGYFSETLMEPDFVFGMADALASNTGITDQMIAELLACISSALEEGNVEMSYVAMIALTGVLDSGREDITAASEDVCRIALAFLGSGDEHLFDAACGLLMEASACCPEVYSPALDELVTALLEHPDVGRALVTLDRMLYYSEFPPSEPAEVLSAIVELIESSAQEYTAALVSCITSTIKSLNEPETYDALMPVISELLGMDDLDVRGRLFECFSYLIKINPAKAAEDSEAILGALVESLQADSDTLSEYAALCISSFAKVLPNTLWPRAQELLSYFGELLKKPLDSIAKARESAGDEEEEENDESEEEESETPRELMIQAVLNAFAAIVNERASELGPQIEDFVPTVLGFIEEGGSKIKAAAVKSIFLMTDGLASINYDASAIYEKIVEATPQAPDTATANELFLTLGGLFICFGPSMSEEQIGAGFGIFRDCLKGRTAAILDGSSKQQSISLDVAQNFFFALRMFVFTLGPRIGGFVEKLQKYLTAWLKSPQKIVQAFVLHTLACIVYALPDVEALPEMVAEAALNAHRQAVNPTAKNIDLAAINILVSARPDVYDAKRVSSLTSIVQTIIHGNNRGENDLYFESAVTLQCTLWASYGLSASRNSLAEVLEHLPPVIDDDDMPFAARFLAWALRNIGEEIAPHAQRIAAAVLASGPWIIRLIDPTAAAAIASVIGELGEEEILQLVGFNQHHANNVIANIAALK